LPGPLDPRRGVEHGEAVLEPLGPAQDGVLLDHHVRDDSTLRRYQLRGPVAAADVFVERVADIAATRGFKGFVVVEHGAGLRSRAGLSVCAQPGDYALRLRARTMHTPLALTMMAPATTATPGTSPQNNHPTAA